MTAILSKVTGVRLRNSYGEFLAGAYRIETGGRATEHLVLYVGLERPPCLVRMTSACFTGDLLGCDRCDCNWQLHESIKLIHDRRQGLLIYNLDEDGRGHGPVAKLKSLLLGDEANIASPAAYEHLGLSRDARNVDATIAILGDLSVNTVHLLTNNPERRALLEQGGINVAATVPLFEATGGFEKCYRWKRAIGHTIPEPPNAATTAADPVGPARKSEQ